MGINLVGVEILTTVIMKRSNFWDITACNPLKVNKVSVLVTTECYISRKQNLFSILRQPNV
jgi:hypothetical protein